MFDYILFGICVVIIPAVQLLMLDSAVHSKFVKIWFSIALIFYGIIGFLFLVISFSYEIVFPSIPFVKFALITDKYSRIISSSLFFVVMSAIVLFYSFKGSDWIQPEFLKGERKFNIMIVFLVGLFILICIIPYFIFPFGSYYMGDFSQGTNVLNSVMEGIFSDPVFMLVAVLTVIGGLTKAVSSSRATRLVSNVLISWLPAFILCLVIIRAIQPPESIINLFGGNDFFAYLMYILINGMVLIGLAGIQQVFAGLRTKLAKE